MLESEVYQPAGEDVDRGVYVPALLLRLPSSNRLCTSLRERFSIDLATATGGVFEVADSTHPSGGRANRTLDLIAIRRP